jgi:glyoxylase-like metal-dependent hydrolase (beta-lactamase superfamily II)
MRNLPLALLAIASTLPFAAASPASAQTKEELAGVKVKSTKLAEGLFLLEGAGGNMALSVGKQGAVLIDDQFAPLSARIRAEARKLGAATIKFVVNTHWHGDHTGGNEALGKAGSIIVAHENVRKRLSSEQFIELMNRKVPASPAAALPVITFTSDLSFHLNGDEVRVIHVDPAHTDGDSIVHLVKANAIHMGDTMMTISYPFVDTSSGGRFAGFIAVADRALALANDTTKIIPGHGPVTDKAGLKAWRDMLVAIRDSIGKLVAQGKTLEQVIAAKPTAQWDAEWGQKFIKPEVLIGAVYRELKEKR